MMSDTNRTRTVDETPYDRFLTLTEGDEFHAAGGNWTVERVEREPRNSTRVITAERVGASHEWARFTADRASLTVNADIHDEDHERCPDMNPHHVTTLAISERASEDADSEDPEDDSEPEGEPRTDGGRDVDSEDAKLSSEYDDFDGSRNTLAAWDGQELFHLLELIREGDEVRVNERRRALTVTGVTDGADSRTINLTGNGTWYSVVLTRADGEPVGAVLHYPSGSEDVTHVTVDNRNPFQIREYDHLLGEELESVAVSDHVDRMMGFVERSPTQSWADLSERDRTGEWTVDGDDLTTVKWAIHAFMAHYRANGRMGGGDTALDYYQDALALWERVRGEREQAWFVGAEFGHIGAYLDYAVEDPAIRARLPEPVVAAADALRTGETVPDISHVNHPEDASADVETDGGQRVMTDGGEDVMAVPELGPSEVSDAGLGIMKRHLIEAYNRIGRAADRSDGVDLNEFGNSGPAFHMADAAASLDEVVRLIEHEQDRRDERADASAELETDGGQRLMTDGGEDVDREDEDTPLAMTGADSPPLKFLGRGTNVTLTYRSRTSGGDQTVTGHVVHNTREDGARQGEHAILTISEDMGERYLSVVRTGDEVTVHTSADGEDVNPLAPEDTGRVIGDAATVDVDLTPITDHLETLAWRAREPVAAELREYSAFMVDCDEYNSLDDLAFRVTVDVSDATRNGDAAWLEAIATIAESVPGLFGDTARDARDALADLREREGEQDSPSERGQRVMTDGGVDVGPADRASERPVDGFAPIVERALDAASAREALGTTARWGAREGALDRLGDARHPMA